MNNLQQQNFVEVFNNLPNIAVQLVSSADSAMYLAKASGRNCVRLVLESSL